MKTSKALRTTTVCNCIFCFSCMLSIACLMLNHHYDVEILFSIGIISLCGWMINPFGILSCYWLLKAYLADRKVPLYKRIIGRKWIWIFIWPVITTVLWLIGDVLFVHFTGGV